MRNSVFFSQVQDIEKQNEKLDKLLKKLQVYIAFQYSFFVFPFIASSRSWCRSSNFQPVVLFSQPCPDHGSVHGFSFWFFIFLFLKKTYNSKLGLLSVELLDTAARLD